MLYNIFGHLAIMYNVLYLLSWWACNSELVATYKNMHVTYLDCTEQTITAYSINDMLPDCFQRAIVAIFIRGLTSQTSWVLRKLDQYLQLFIYCPVGPPSLVPVSTSSWKEGLEMTVNAIYEHATCSDRSSGYTTCSSGSFFIILPSIVHL